MVLHVPLSHILFKCMIQTCNEDHSMPDAASPDAPTIKQLNPGNKMQTSDIMQKVMAADYHCLKKQQSWFTS